ncbi:MAG: hypothetical protein PHR16_17825 [Methylovulum sp.]|nr:hypothetical protein [Methylovulum sp.]
MPDNLVELTLSPDWHGLSKHLIATFSRVDHAGTPQPETTYAGQIYVNVKAAVTECNISFEPGWQSTMENLNAGNVAPTLLAMLQSGAIQPVIDAINVDKLAKNVSFGNGAINEAIKSVGGVVDSLKNKAPGYLNQFEGRTGITKLNSTQVFSGMPPVKIAVTVLFRAWHDPAREVEAPINLLVSWALPQRLSPDSLGPLVKAAQGEGDLIDAMLPSFSPAMVSFHYKNRLYSPMVIESIGLPLDSPVDRDGHFVELLVPMTLCSLTAWDKNDWLGRVPSRS